MVKIVTFNPTKKSAVSLIFGLRRFAEEESKPLRLFGLSHSKGKTKAMEDRLEIEESVWKLWMPYFALIYGRVLKRTYKVFNDDPLITKIQIELDNKLNKTNDIDFVEFAKYLSQKYREDLDEVMSTLYAIVRSKGLIKT